MKILFDTSIDKTKWDLLVHSFQESTVFSLSTYLDSVAEKWCIVVNENYTAGMAVPFMERLGKRIVYTPVFMRYSEWIGEPSLHDQALKLIKQAFDAGSLNFRVDTTNLDRDDLLCYQLIKPGYWQINEQARRMLKRFDRSGMTIHRNGNIEVVLKYIDVELSKRIPGINQRSLKRLKSLVSLLNHRGLLETITVYDGSNYVGGIFIVRHNNRTLYLKGSFSEKAKKEGAMYATMNLAIEETMLRNELFDFGGSNAQGVRRFNLNFGGGDEFYSVLKWDKLPFWFTMLERLKKWIKK